MSNFLTNFLKMSKKNLFILAVNKQLLKVLKMRYFKVYNL